LTDLFNNEEKTVLADKLGKDLQLTDSRIFYDTAYEATGMLIQLQMANWKEQAKKSP
jgi:hypothetical protein